MKINSVNFTNFKGRSGTYSLGNVTLITGGNFTNKTTIPLAIRLGMAGYLPPPIGSRNIYQLAGNPDQAGYMGIELDFDNSGKVVWKWTRTQKGTVQTEGGVMANIAMPELALDPRLFFGKTGSERTEIVFGVCPIDPKTFNNRSLKQKFSGIDHPPTDIREKTLLEIFEQMDANPISNVPKWFMGLRDYLKAKASEAALAHKQASGAFAAFRVNETMPARDYSAELAEAKADASGFKVGQQVDTQVIKGNIDRLLRAASEYDSPESYDRQIAALLPTGPVVEPEEIEARLRDLDVERRNATVQRARAKEAIKALKAEKAKFNILECCPTCGAETKNWKLKAERRIDTSIEKEAESEAAATAKLKTADDQYKTLSVLLENHRKTDKLQDARNAVSSLLDEIAKLEESLAEPSPEDISRSAALAELQARIADLESKQRDFTAYQSDRARMVELEKALLTASCRAETFKSAGKLLLEAQSTIIDGAFGAVLKTAKYFTDGLLNSPIEFSEGELGRRVSQRDITMGCLAPVGSWIPFAAFSGTEELLALAGFSVALTGNAPVKLVVLDEMGRLEPSRKLDVALRMLSLSETGVIDQAILLDVSPKDFAGILNRPGFVNIKI